ncbi:MAG: NAD(P)-dependent alcohol dehydrogenase [Candidatus Brocadiia bacterium]
MSQEMKAAYMTGPCEVTVREEPRPVPGPGEVLVALNAVGICGSDVHFFQSPALGERARERPFILGHECAGTVVQAGEDVQGLRVGDAVAIEPGVPCGRCAMCREGRYNLCPEEFFMGAPPDEGAFREYVAWPEEFAYRLPEEMDCELGALAEPLAVGLHACNLVDLRGGDRVVVLGAGPIGLLAAAAADANGAAHITVVDLLPDRLAYAAQMGATETVNAAETDVTGALADSADVVLDCVGVAETAAQSFQIARHAGRVAWVGMAASTAEVSLTRARCKELTVVGVFRYANVYPRAVGLLASGRIAAASLITHRFAFPRVQEALTFSAEHPVESLKTMVVYD